MSIIDTRKVCHDQILEVVKFAGIAAYKAPKIANTKIKMEIITGEDLLALADILEIIGEQSYFVKLDAKAIKKNYAAGEPVVELLIGADTTHSDLNWNCGACGFNTCAEFNKFSKENKSSGNYYGGPTCNWKAYDYGIAQAWACATLHQHRVENRAQTSYGAAALMMGHMQGCNVCVGFSIGPNNDQVYFSRPDIIDEMPKEKHDEALINVMPELFIGFVGGGNPALKYTTNYEWMTEPKFIKAQEDPEYDVKQQEMMTRIMAVIERESKKRAEREKE
jgi:uncharacterized ferredoxin-like protein